MCLYLRVTGLDVDIHGFYCGPILDLLGLSPCGLEPQANLSSSLASQRL